MSWKKARDPKGVQTGGRQEEEEGVGPGSQAGTWSQGAQGGPAEGKVVRRSLGKGRGCGTFMRSRVGGGPEQVEICPQARWGRTWEAELALP